MKSISLIAVLLFLVSCSGVGLKQTKPDGYTYGNGLPECSWSNPFTACESKDQVKPIYTACPEGYRDLANGMPNHGIYCVPNNQVPSTVQTIKRGE